MLDLIEARMGILDLLDESCRFPKVGCWGPAFAAQSCWLAGSMWSTGLRTSDGS